MCACRSNVAIVDERVRERLGTKKLWIQLSGLFLLAVDLEVIVYGILYYYCTPTLNTKKKTMKSQLEI